MRRILKTSKIFIIPLVIVNHNGLRPRSVTVGDSCPLLVAFVLQLDCLTDLLSTAYLGRYSEGPMAGLPEFDSRQGEVICHCNGVQTGSRAHPASYTMSIRGYFSWLDRSVEPLYLMPSPAMVELPPNPNVCS
jgi:hypothetical protein